MQRYLLWVDRLSMWVGKAFAWLIIPLILIVTYDIAATKFFQAPTRWVFDVSIILYGTLFMMGGAYTLSRNAHVRGDVFYRRWPVRVQAGVDLALYILFFFPGIIALVSSGTQWAALSWEMREMSSTSPLQSPIYPYKTVIPVAAGLLLLQGLVETARSVIALRTGVWPPRLADVEETEKRLAEELV